MKVSLLASMTMMGGIVFLAWFPSGSECLKCYEDECEIKTDFATDCPLGDPKDCDKNCVYSEGKKKVKRLCGEFKDSVCMSKVNSTVKVWKLRSGAYSCAECITTLSNAAYDCKTELPPKGGPTTPTKGSGDSSTPRHSSAPPTGLLQPASKTMMMTMTVLIIVTG